MDLLKNPGGGACPELAAWLADGVGFRPVALSRERERQRAKSWSPPPPTAPSAAPPPRALRGRPRAAGAPQLRTGCFSSGTQGALLRTF